MRKPASKIVQLVVLGALLASCAQEEKAPQQEVHMRADSSARYANTTEYVQTSNGTNHMLMGMLMGRILFSPMHSNGGGYASSKLPASSNVGKNVSKSRSYSKSKFATSGRSAIKSTSSSTRGGFGSSSRSVSS